VRIFDNAFVASFHSAANSHKFPQRFIA